MVQLVIGAGMQKKEMLKWIEELFESSYNGVPYNLTFIGSKAKLKENEFLTDIQSVKIEKALKKRFELWCNTWIIPNLKRLKKELEKKY